MLTTRKINTLNLDFSIAVMDILHVLFRVVIDRDEGEQAWSIKLGQLNSRLLLVK